MSCHNIIASFINQSKHIAKRFETQPLKDCVMCTYRFYRTLELKFLISYCRRVIIVTKCSTAYEPKLCRNEILIVTVKWQFEYTRVRQQHSVSRAATAKTLLRSSNSNNGLWIMCVYHGTSMLIHGATPQNHSYQEQQTQQTN